MNAQPLSGREWKPGDVAMVDSWRGRGQIAFRAERGDVTQWCVLDGTDTRGLSDSEVSSAYPAVVINPEDREQVGRLLVAVFDDLTPAPAGTLPNMQSALRSMLTPPKPHEPKGLGAVVEDAKGGRWVRVQQGCWVHRGDGLDGRSYGEIAAVKVLSPGWSE